MNDYCELKDKYGTENTDKFIIESVKLFGEARKRTKEIKSYSFLRKLLYIVSVIPVYFKHEWWNYYLNEKEYKIYKTLKALNETRADF